jgi:hypothetical protein
MSLSSISGGFTSGFSSLSRKGSLSLKRNVLHRRRPSREVVPVFDITGDIIPEEEGPTPKSFLDFD